MILSRPSSRPGGASGRGNEVPARSAFVGRARDLHAVDRCLDDGARIVTITGAAGMGKTRLALEWARRARGAGGASDRDEASLFFCDLSEARDIDDACAVFARAFAVPLAAAGRSRRRRPSRSSSRGRARCASTSS